MFKVLTLMIACTGLQTAFCVGSLLQAQSPLPSSNEQSALVGTWEWSLDMGPAGGKVSMVVELVDRKLKAKVTAPDGSVLDANDLKVKNDQVTFSIKNKKGLLEIVMEHSGKLEQDKIMGTLDLKGGPMKKSGKWDATRQKSK